jgi:RimJ/RimL family protein N-acetyltransferase
LTSLETERLRLRQLRQTDLDEYADICADPEVMRFLGGKPFTRAESWRHIATMLGHWQLRGYGMFALEEQSSGRLLGRIGFNNPEGWLGFELGWTLGRAYWGRGFATEAASRALEYAFSSLDQGHVISLIHPDNAPSIGVAERIGEKLEGSTDLLGTQVHVFGAWRP